MKPLPLVLQSVLLLAGFLRAENSPPPKHWELAPTPPMGWNSYDNYGSSVTEEEFLANALFMKEHLLSHGWNYAIVDYRWYDADAANHDRNGVGGPVVMDAYGRVVPAPNRFPSAADGKGFKALADKTHAMGLKFGIHVMRGIPRQAVSANTPIEGSSFRAADAANQKSSCGWCKDMWGVNVTNQAGQDYYDSIFRLYASWGVDFVKVDDLSTPYHLEEIEAIRRAIDKCGRPMVLSTSPGETSVNQAAHIARHANMWRMAGDFWDKWKELDHMFDLAAAWQGTGGPGRWPDADMIPLGRIGTRCVGGSRMTRFTKDEQVTLMSLFSLIPSPLMLGMNLTDLDPWTTSLITNDEVIAINQDPLGLPGKRVSQNQTAEVWAKPLKDGSLAVGLFNRGDSEAVVSAEWGELGLQGKQKVRDVWQKKDLGIMENRIQQTVPKHGAVLLRVSPAAQ